MVELRPELTDIAVPMPIDTHQARAEMYMLAGVRVKARAYNAFLQGQFRESTVRYCLTRSSRSSQKRGSIRYADFRAHAGELHAELSDRRAARRSREPRSAVGLGSSVTPFRFLSRWSLKDLCLARSLAGFF